MQTLFAIFEESFLQIFQLSLIIKVTLKKFWLQRSIFTMALQTMTQYSRFFYRKDLFVNRNKFFLTSKISPITAQTKFIFLKNSIQNN
jgi:hypothetical protein